MSRRDKVMSAVVKNLEQVYDPEMPSVSVIHLGLIYDIEISFLYKILYVKD